MISDAFAHSRCSNVLDSGTLPVNSGEIDPGNPEETDPGSPGKLTHPWVADFSLQK